MRAIIVTLTAATAAANSAPIRVNWRQSPFNMSLAFVDSGSTTGFTVQYTMDEPSRFATAALWNSGGTWFDHSVMANMTGNQYGEIDIPVQGVRLHCNNSGTDTGTLTITQGQNG